MNFDFIRDLFAQFRPVTVKRMFSGAVLYCDGVMFALVVRGTVYLKADEITAWISNARAPVPSHIHAARNRAA